MTEPVVKQKKPVSNKGCFISLALFVLAIVMAFVSAFVIRSGNSNTYNQLKTRSITVPGEQTFELTQGVWAVWTQGTTSGLDPKDVTVTNTANDTKVTVSDASSPLSGGLTTVKTATADDGTIWQEAVKFTVPSSGRYQVKVDDIVGKKTVGVGADITEQDQGLGVLLATWGVAFLLVLVSGVLAVIWIIRKATADKGGEPTAGGSAGPYGSAPPAYPTQPGGYGPPGGQPPYAQPTAPQHPPVQPTAPQYQPPPQQPTAPQYQPPPQQPTAPQYQPPQPVPPDQPAPQYPPTPYPPTAPPTPAAPPAAPPADPGAPGAF